jgi:hypothetical protein
MKPQILILLLVIGAGCVNQGAGPPRGPAAPAVPPQVKKNDVDNPTIKEARADTEAALNDLLAGEYDNDPNYAPIARKLKGFDSWVIDSQEVDPDNPRAVNIGGTLQGPSGGATFTASMRKQQDGRWMIGAFSGPDRK